MGGRGGFWEGRTYKFVEKGGIFWKGGIDSGIRKHFSKSRKGGGRSWEGSVDSGGPQDLPRGIFCNLHPGSKIDPGIVLRGV